MSPPVVFNLLCLAVCFRYGVEGPFFKQLGEDYILESFTLARAYSEFLLKWPSTVFC